jgi:hypothetical protein
LDGKTVEDGLYRLVRDNRNTIFDRNKSEMSALELESGSDINDFTVDEFAIYVGHDYLGDDGFSHALENELCQMLTSKLDSMPESCQWLLKKNWNKKMLSNLRFFVV